MSPCGSCNPNPNAVWINGEINLDPASVCSAQTVMVAQNIWEGIQSGDACLAGCMDAAYVEFDANATWEPAGSCINLIPPGGCTNPAAWNYDASATVDNFSCSLCDADPFIAGYTTWDQATANQLYYANGTHYVYHLGLYYQNYFANVGGIIMNTDPLAFNSLWLACGALSNPAFAQYAAYTSYPNPLQACTDDGLNDGVLFGSPNGSIDTWSLFWNQSYGVGDIVEWPNNSGLYYTLLNPVNGNNYNTPNDPTNWENGQTPWAPCGSCVDNNGFACT